MATVWDVPRADPTPGPFGAPGSIYERVRGPLRYAALPAEQERVTLGVHSEVAEHCGLREGQYEPHVTTLDYVVAAAGAWLAGTFEGALPGALTTR